MMALEQRGHPPLFFEIHRLSLFSPRSLDVDVVLDLMIHDLDIVLALAGAEPEEIRAAGISILSAKVDIANVRLQFPRRLRGQPDRQPRLHRAGPQTAPVPAAAVPLARLRPQDLAVFTVSGDRQIGFEQAPVDKSEPLKLQFDAFLDSVEPAKFAETSGTRARQTLAVALAILDKIKEHSRSRLADPGGWMETVATTG